MSTSPILDRTAPIYRRTMPPETQILPAIQALSARDFKVCENCGGPAMLHPKFEMAPDRRRRKSGVVLRLPASSGPQGPANGPSWRSALALLRLWIRACLGMDEPLGLRHEAGARL